MHILKFKFDCGRTILSRACLQIPTQTEFPCIESISLNFILTARSRTFCAWTIFFEVFVPTFQ
jgi:hypothetical protein